MSKAIVIGISGCSNSGKTSIANQLSHVLPKCKIIAQDEYFYHESSNLVEYIDDLKMYNYDVITSVNMKRLNEDLNSYLYTYDYIILEGFLIYSDDVLVKSFDKKYFITNVSRELCEQRRKNRNYLGFADEKGYFDNYVWRNYLKYEEECKNLNVYYLNGHKALEELVNIILKDLKLLF